MHAREGDREPALEPAPPLPVSLVSPCIAQHAARPSLGKVVPKVAPPSTRDARCAVVQASHWALRNSERYATPTPEVAAVAAVADASSTSNMVA